MTSRTALLASIVFVLAGCNQEPPAPQKPQIQTDKDSIGFGLEYNSGTYVGTSTQESILIENTGMEDLVITSANITGSASFAPAFTLQGPDKTTVPWKQHAFITVFFKPTQAQKYYTEDKTDPNNIKIVPAVKLTIVSNAENTPSKEILLSGLGVAPPAQ